MSEVAIFGKARYFLALSPEHPRVFRVGSVGRSEVTGHPRHLAGLCQRSQSLVRQGISLLLAQNIPEYFEWVVLGVLK